MSIATRFLAKPLTPARRLAFFFVMTAAHVGVPLLAWGFDDVGGFFANPARASFIAVTVALLAFMAVLMSPGMMSKGAEGKYVREWTLAFYRVFLLGVIVGSAYCDRGDLWTLGESESVRYVGLVACLVGALLSAWVPLHMGRQFSGYVTIQEGHRLITDGPFRWIRHPRYLGVTLYVVGMTLVYHSLVGLAFSAVCTGLFVVRIRIEEGVLKREFAAQWIDYCRRTKRLVPLIW